MLDNFSASASDSRFAKQNAEISAKTPSLFWKVTACINANPDTRMDERAAMQCAHAIGVNSSDETMFSACWNMALERARLAAINGAEYVGAATEAVIETAEKKAAIVIDSFVSHVTEYRKHRATVGAQRRAAVAVRHDLGRMFSRRFF